MNFGTTQGTSTVSFNNTPAGTATTWSAGSIVINVPTGATSGNVVVTVGGTASNGVYFAVGSGPTITSLSPSGGPVGVPVTITGTNFGATQGTSTVAFNGTPAGTATTWSATSIVINVPVGTTTGNVVVTVGGVASNGVKFTIGPSITGISLPHGPIQMGFKITGTNFGAAPSPNCGAGQTCVSLAGVPLTIITWGVQPWDSCTPAGQACITVQVPGTATSGNVVVTVGGQASNGAQFTVEATFCPNGNAPCPF
jgi:hypothetical protein